METVYEGSNPSFPTQIYPLSIMDRTFGYEPRDMGSIPLVGAYKISGM